MPVSTPQPRGRRAWTNHFDSVGINELESRLQIQPGQSVALINAPVESRLRLLATGRPDRADVVIGFVTRPVDLAWLKPAYAAVHAGRLVWVSHPKHGRPGCDLRRDWLTRALHQYGVAIVQEEVINESWSAVRLRPDTGAPG